jgi:hypothetical protein
MMFFGRKNKMMVVWNELRKRGEQRWVNCGVIKRKITGESVKELY